MSLSYRRRCVPGARRRRATFSRTGIRRRVHSARNKRIAQSFGLRLSRSGHCKGNKDCKSSGCEAFHGLSRCRSACSFHCFHCFFELLLVRLFGQGLGFQGCGTTGDTAPGYSNLRLMYENPPLSVVGGLTHSDAVSPTKTGKSRRENQTPLYKGMKGGCQAKPTSGSNKKSKLDA